MPSQLFIPGKNWRLSLAELASFLEARRIKFVVCSLSKEFFVVSVEAKVGLKRVYPFQKEIFAKNIVAQQNLTEIASLVDAEERHKIGREIHIFRK